MLRECIYGECATLTHTITAYSVSGNVVPVCILIRATRQKLRRKRVNLSCLAPCRCWELWNRCSPFPGQMVYKAPKPAQPSSWLGTLGVCIGTSQVIGRKDHLWS